jgi:hypothetical protein
MLTTHPSIIVFLIIGALFEMWIVFALIYAAPRRGSERPYWSRVRYALKLRFSG